MEGVGNGLGKGTEADRLLNEPAHTQAVASRDFIGMVGRSHYYNWQHFEPFVSSNLFQNFQSAHFGQMEIEENRNEVVFVRM